MKAETCTLACPDGTALNPKVTASPRLRNADGTRS